LTDRGACKVSADEQLRRRDRSDHPSAVGSRGQARASGAAALDLDEDAAVDQSGQSRTCGSA
jgi:hypothetical protein